MDPKKEDIDIRVLRDSSAIDEPAPTSTGETLRVNVFDAIGVGEAISPSPDKSEGKE